MPKSHRPRRIPATMVDLVRSRHTPEALSREFEPTAQAISSRPIAMKAADRTARPAPTRGADPLRRERQLRQERDILAGRGLVRTGDRQDDGLQLHRGMVQSRPSPFWHPVSIPNRLRDADAQGNPNDLSDQPSTKTGQLHTVPLV